VCAVVSSLLTFPLGWQELDFHLVFTKILVKREGGGGICGVGGTGDEGGPGGALGGMWG